MCKDAPGDPSAPCKVLSPKKMTVIHIIQLLQMLRLPAFVSKCIFVAVPMAGE
jgi:hypothetical protein